MKLADLVKRIPGSRLIGDGQLEVARPRYDSRTIEPGDLFCAIVGETADGNNFIQQAVGAGAVAILSEKSSISPEVPRIIVEDDRAAMAHAAHALYGDPTGRVEILGVTGTNGKTTSTHVIQSILNASGLKAGRIGTVGWEFEGRGEPLARTTPEAPDILELISRMADNGATHIAMEVTSIAVPMKRIAGFRFRSGLFTNFSQDHLDFHGNMEAYFEAKRGFFKMLPKEAVAISNAEDAYGGRILEGINATTLTFGFTKSCDFKGSIVGGGRSGQVVRVEYGRREIELDSPLIGDFNGENILGSASVALAIGVAPEAVIEGTANAPQVRGRMERVELEGDVTAVIDYSHTPDALELALRALRPMTDGRLFVVFGAGGDRDRGKRLLMGTAAAKLADKVIVTSDNPRNEDPDAILADIRIGATDDHVIAVTDRDKAIRLALQQAAGGDVVLIAGKGHETYQEVEGVRHHFDDREEVLKARAVAGEAASC